MNSETVIVKDVSGCALVRHVVKTTADVVFVASSEVLKSIKSGDRNAFPIGFPRECVFKHDGRKLTGKINWATMKPWRND
jgi:hypothetical protein